MCVTRAKSGHAITVSIDYGCGSRIANAILNCSSMSPGTITSPSVEKYGETVKNPLYRVVLLDDDDHTYDYVIEMLQKLFIFSNAQALQHAEEVDAQGRT